jgi:hypothetical protein
MIDEFDFYDEPEDYEPPKEPDSYFLAAQEDIRQLYETDKKSVFYVRQLQLKFEKKYFHWVTYNALIGLSKMGYLKEIKIDKEKGTSTHYFIHKSNRYPMREINKIEEVVEEYSQDLITRSCGHRAEDLFCKAFALRSFMPVGIKVKQYNGKTWTKTGHDLDFVFKRDGVEYGCEIKNTLGYIEKDELEIKLEMCEYLKFRPLFIMRYSPKSYNRMIYEKGGFALIFETQIYEISQEMLVNKIKEVIGLPVICSKAIPDGMMGRFEKWHIKNVNS